MNENTELRHLLNSIFEKLAAIFDQDLNALRLLIGNVPARMNDRNCTELRFNALDFETITNAARQTSHGSPFKIFINEWATMGRIRATIRNLLELLIKCQLFRCADHVADLMNLPLPLPRPAEGPAAPVDISLPISASSSHNDINRNHPNGKPPLNSPNMKFAAPNSASDNESIRPPLPINPPPIEPLINVNSASRSITQSRKSRSDLLKFSASEVAAVVPVPDSPSKFIPNITELNLPSQVESEPSCTSSANIPEFVNEYSEDSDAGLPAILGSIEISGQTTNLSNSPAFSQILGGETSSVFPTHSESSKMQQSQSQSEESDTDEDVDGDHDEDDKNKV